MYYTISLSLLQFFLVYVLKNLIKFYNFDEIYHVCLFFFCTSNTRHINTPLLSVSSPCIELQSLLPNCYEKNQKINYLATYSYFASVQFSKSLDFFFLFYNQFVSIELFTYKYHTIFFVHYLKVFFCSNFVNYIKHNTTFRLGNEFRRLLFQSTQVILFKRSLKIFVS